MRVSDFLPPELVLPTIAAERSEDVLDALAERLASHYPEIDLPTLTGALRERERQVTTALTDGVAIPHARLRGLPRTVAAFGRSPAGVDCGSHDGRPTHLFFLLVVPEESPGGHLKLLASVSRVLSDARCRARLLAAGDAAALLDVLRDHEAGAPAATRAA
jgi:PTS system nitrogen regulatory IIA component